MSIIDFLRQRRRWFQGLVKTVLYAPTKMRWRMSLGLSTGVWALAPFALIYTIINLFTGVEIPSIVRILAIYSFSTNILWYAIGLRVNMDEHAIKSALKRILITLAQIIFVPAFGALEALGVLWALASPARGFDVVEK
jgi:egghead protein (zeste-white 4 protein)